MLVTWRGALAQVGLGMTPLEAGQVGLPWPLGIGVASGVSVQLAPRIGCRLLGLGALLMVVGMGALILALRLAGAEVAGWHLLPGLALGGAAGSRRAGPAARVRSHRGAGAVFALAFLLVPLLPARPRVPEWDERR